MDGLLDAADPNEATFAYSKTSNCKTCHLHYAGHGSAVRATGCMDCHDPHGDAAAANNNARMLRSSVFGETGVLHGGGPDGGAFYKAGSTTGSATTTCATRASRRTWRRTTRAARGRLAQPWRTATT